MSNKEKVLFKVTNLFRTDKKLIIAEPKISSVIEAANNKGMRGTKLLLESDGSPIDEDEILQFLTNDTILLIQENESWVPFPMPSTSATIIQNVGTQKSCIDNLDDNSLFFINLPHESTTCNSDSNSSLPTTLSISSGALSDSDNEAVSSMIKRTFDRFCIPWNKFPLKVMEVCNKGEKLGPYLKTVVHIIVDDLRTISPYIPTRVFRDTLTKLTEKYPKTFLYTDTTGNTIAIKHSPIITTFIHRNNYLNRPQKSQSQFHSKIPFKKRITSKNFQNTCKNWQPVFEQDLNNTEMSVNEKVNKLKELSWKKTFSKEEYGDIENIMDNTYLQQRTFLNNLESTPSVKDLKEEWPFLVHKHFIYKHFQKLTNVGINSVMGNFCQNIKKVLKYGDIQKSKIMVTIYNTDKGDEEHLAVTFLSKYFNECRDSVFKKYPIGTSFNEIKPPGPFPWFAVIESADGSCIYYVYADNELFNSSSTCFKEAFIQTFCIYFNLNIEYPKDASQFYEFVQRFFFEMYTEDSRGRKKNMTAMAKVIRLVSAIQKVQLEGG